MIVHTLVAVAATCTAAGTFTTGNATQAWAWNLGDRGGRISGVVAYAGANGVQRANVAGTRSNATLSLRITDGSGRVRRAKAGVTCSQPTPQTPIDKILFVRVARVPVSHLAFPRVRPAGEGALLAAARASNVRLPPAPPPGGLRGWLDAMNAVLR